MSEPVTRNVTILISDLRGFTAIAEELSPTAMIQILNLYLTRMSEIIFKHGGQIDKFMGDSIMAVFGLPEPRGDDLKRATACAVAMQRSMFELNQRNSELGFPHLFMGIGINTGQVVAGELGSELYSEYTIIGDEVNLASRIEAYSLRGQILLSEHSHQLASEFIDAGEANRVQVKGKRDPIALYELRAILSPEHLEVPRVEARKSARVDVDLPLSFSLLEGKQVAEENVEGRVQDLSYHGMRALVPLELGVLSEIKIELSLSLLATNSTAIYAKILRSDPAQDGWSARMEFTHIDQAAQSAVKNFIDQIICAR